MRKAITNDIKEDMHFGAGNEYNVWSFYGKITEDGKFVHPDEDGFHSRDFIMIFMADAYSGFMRFVYLLAFSLANI